MTSTSKQINNILAMMTTIKINTDRTLNVAVHVLFCSF